MRWSLRVSLVLAAGSLSCVGGPVSDWPSKGHDDPTSSGDDSDGEGAPRPPGSSSAGRGMDGGAIAPSTPASDGAGGDAGANCAPDAGACPAACSDAGVPSLGDPLARERSGCSAVAPLSD